MCAAATPWRDRRTRCSAILPSTSSASRRSRRSSAPASATCMFAGPGHDEDFGLEEITGNPADRYKFRTAPLRNLAVAPASSTTGVHRSGGRDPLPPRTSSRAPAPTTPVAGVPPDLRPACRTAGAGDLLDPEIRQPRRSVPVNWTISSRSCATGCRPSRQREQPLSARTCGCPEWQTRAAVRSL